MVLSNFEWGLIVAAASIISGILVFFLKDIFRKNDKQSDDIQEIQKKFASRDELNSATTALRSDNKRIGDKMEAHEKDIHEIKRTYVTKGELKEIKAELRDETKKLAEDVAEIKEHYIRRDDFYRVTSDIKQDVQKIYNFLIQQERGKGNGQK